MSAGKLSHLQINVKPENLSFYRELFSVLDWKSGYSDDVTASFLGSGDLSLWFIGEANGAVNDRDGAGVNHIGLLAESQAAVDRTVAFLQERGIEQLFETPRHHPDYSSEQETYYQIMFESPDAVLFEHVYIGPKQE